MLFFILMVYALRGLLVVESREEQKPVEAKDITPTSKWDLIVYAVMILLLLVMRDLIIS